MQTINYQQLKDAHISDEIGMPKDYVATIPKFIHDFGEKISINDILHVICQYQVLSNKEFRLYTVWCLEQIRHILTDDKSRKALEIIERFANGEATQAELITASISARDMALTLVTCDWAAALENTRKFGILTGKGYKSYAAIALCVACAAETNSAAWATQTVANYVADAYAWEIANCAARFVGANKPLKEAYKAI